MDPLHKDCELRYSHTSKQGVRAFYCRAHDEWCYDTPTAKVYEYSEEAEERMNKAKPHTGPIMPPEEDIK